MLFNLCVGPKTPNEVLKVLSRLEIKVCSDCIPTGHRAHVNILLVTRKNPAVPELPLLAPQHLYVIVYSSRKNMSQEIFLVKENITHIDPLVRVLGIYFVLSTGARGLQFVSVSLFAIT